MVQHWASQPSKSLKERTQMNLFKTLLVVAVALTLGASVLSAQTFQAPAAPGFVDVYTVDYYSNANTTGAPDGTVRIINSGESSLSPTAALDLCALIYVFDANQEMSECCGCFVSANALLTLSVNRNLTANPLLGSRLQTGVIKILSAAPVVPHFCSASDITASGPGPGLRAWATHIQNRIGTTTPANFPETEGESQAATLGNGEVNDLFEDCLVLTELGSGAGICRCGPVT
jgi:hypothetical protein